MAVLPFENNKLNGAKDKALSFANGFTPGQKAMTAIAIVATIAGASFLLSHGSSPQYTTLFAGLQPADAASVTQKLTADKVPYQLADGGATILVPAADVNQERINLAEGGLPSGSTISFQTLSSTGITSSQFVQNVDYQQALEGQLASTIESIQGVTRAQVSIVMPGTGTFSVGNTQNPSASVLVDLASGTTLSTEQVSAIVHLTASSVPQLNPQDVTVVDNNGNVLSAPGVNNSASSNAQETATYENTLATQLTALLDQVVGPNNAAVQVHSVLNFNQQTTTLNGFELGKNGKPIVVPASTSKTTDKYIGAGAGTAASGALGAGTPATTSGSGGNYTSNQSSVTNSVGNVSQTTQNAPGQVVTTSVAVVINQKAKAGASAASLAQIRSIITAAAGLNLKTGDSLVVSTLPFSSAATPALTTATKSSMVGKIMGSAPAIAFLLLVLIMFMLSNRALKKRRPRFEEIALSDFPEALPPGGALADPRAMDTGEIPAVTTEAIGRLMPGLNPVPSEVDSYIKQNPSEVAELMRLWAVERSGA